MGWIDDLDNSVFTITTGDGRVWQPLLRITETSKEFNIAVFDFINKEGSFIDRKKAKGRKFPLTFYFSGADNIATAAAFDTSANDSRAWKIKHPFYGNITGQPASISRNDASYNSTEITVEFWESITEVLPKQTTAITDVIKQKRIDVRTISAIDYINKVILKPADVTIAKDLSEKLNAAIGDVLDSTGYNDFQEIKNNAAAKLDKLITAPSAAISSVSDVISFPADLEFSVKNRIDLLKYIYQSIKGILIKPTKNNKALFEAGAAATVVAIAQTVVTPQPDNYITRNDVVSAAAELTTIYNDYTLTLDGLYNPIFDIGYNFTASSQTQKAVFDTVVQTIANLNQLAFNAKQERIVLLGKDSNIIKLCHQYVGLDADDKNLEQFRTINKIGNRLLFTVKKGRQIRYYV